MKTKALSQQMLMLVSGQQCRQQRNHHVHSFAEKAIVRHHHGRMQSPECRCRRQKSSCLMQCAQEAAKNGVVTAHCRCRKRVGCGSGALVRVLTVRQLRWCACVCSTGNCSQAGGHAFAAVTARDGYADFPSSALHTYIKLCIWERLLRCKGCHDNAATPCFARRASFWVLR